MSFQTPGWLQAAVGSLKNCIFFLIIVHSVQSPRATQSRLTEFSCGMSVNGGGKKCSLWSYVGKIVVSSRFEEVKIVLIREESFWESVPQSSRSWEEVVGKDLLSY